MVDLDARSVEPLESPKAGGLKTIADLRAAGVSVIKGADVALVVKSAAAASSGHYEG
ncbi:hypothetical protein D3C87_2042670 [compost metagenome]